MLPTLAIAGAAIEMVAINAVFRERVPGLAIIADIFIGLLKGSALLALRRLKQKYAKNREEI